MRHTALPQVLAFGAVVLAACDGAAPPQSPVERIDSAGITLVHNVGPDRPLAWRFEKVLDLGTKDDGPEAFHRVFGSGVGTDAAGRLYVLDAGNHTVTVFDGAGEVVRRMGRQGGGPGEFRFPTDLAVSDDGAVAVWDFDKGGLVGFASDGSVLPERRIHGALQRQLALTAHGVIGALRTFASGDDEAGRTRLLAIAAEDTIEFAARAHGPVAPVQFACMTVALPRLLEPEIVWSARRDRVVVSHGVDLDLAIFAGQRLAARWRRALPRIAATVELAGRELGEDSMRMRAGTVQCAVHVSEAAAMIGHAETVPLVKRVAVARDGHIWVQRRTELPGHLVTDIFAADGAYVGTLPADAPFPAAFRGTDEIVVVERDALDLPHVVVYRVMS